MDKREFLETLRRSLQGRVGQADVNEHLRYYDEYIMTRERQGYTQEEVLKELGDPRLIARTIIDTYQKPIHGAAENDYYAGYDSQEDVQVEDVEERRFSATYRQFRFSLWAVLFGVIAILLLILFLVGAIISWLFPVLMPVCLVFLLLSLLRGRRQ